MLKRQTNSSMVNSYNRKVNFNEELQNFTLSIIVDEQVPQNMQKTLTAGNI